MIRIDAGEAMRRSMDNPAARVASRQQGGGGEVWPRLVPNFGFDRRTRIFAIGSCFATNIENELVQRDFDVRSSPARHGIDWPSGLLNKYSPATIRQEIAWAREIFDRDDTMRPDDAAKLFIDGPDGKVLDSQLHGMEFEDPDSALARRADVYRIFREVFSADLLILTLGLVEAFWDDKLKLYLQRAPKRQMLDEAGRFFFERLDYEACLTHCREAIALVRRGRAEPKILLTTSPVVLARTFTSDDIRVANTYSKSVLRAVCGKLAEETESLDYFPSYESVVLSPTQIAYADDLTHVRPPFVAQIMSRVRAVYVAEDADSGTTALDAVSAFLKAVEQGDLAESGQLLDALGPEAMTASADACYAAALVRLLQDNLDAARALVPQRPIPGGTPMGGIRTAAAMLFDAAGDADMCLKMRAGLGKYRDDPHEIRRALRVLSHFGRLDLVPRLSASWNTAELRKSGQVRRSTQMLNKMGDREGERRVLEDFAERVADVPVPKLLRLGELMEEDGDHAGAARMFARAAAASAYARAATMRAVNAHRRVGDKAGAAALLGHMIAAGTGEARHAAMKTRLEAAAAQPEAG